MGEEPAGSGKRKVLLVEDHLSFSEALGMAIDSQQDMSCAGLAKTVAEALTLAEELAPDVVLMDVHLPDLDGIEGTKRIRKLLPGVSVLILTSSTEPKFMAMAAAAGACGFLVKTSGIADILQAIRTAGEGGMVVDPSTLSEVLRHVERRDEEPPPAGGLRFTDRETEVLTMMGAGADPGTIAKRLGISVHTCRGHVKNIIAKLGVHSQLEAVVTAVRLGYLPELRA